MVVMVSKFRRLAQRKSAFVAVYFWVRYMLSSIFGKKLTPIWALPITKILENLILWNVGASSRLIPREF